MTFRASLSLGIRKVNRTKRLVVFAWTLNVLLALVAAGPMLEALDHSIAPTVMEERLLNELDVNWLETFKAEHSGDDIVQMLGYSILGAAPFYEHLDLLIHGRMVKVIGGFIGGLVFEFRVRPEVLHLGAVLALMYVLAWTYLSGGFIGVYAREHRSSFTEFLELGARYFGKFFRLALLQMIVYIILFMLLVDWASKGIPAWTAHEPSEATAVVYAMVRNLLTVLAVGFITLCFDYAKIRMVIESRVSALAALGAGVRFVFKHPVRTVTLALSLAALGVACAAMFVVLEAQIRQSSFWMILAVFVLQQLYVWSRQWLRAAFYAAQTTLYQGSATEALGVPAGVQAAASPAAHG